MTDVESKNTQNSTEIAENKVTKALSMRWALPFVPFVASALYLRYLNLIGRPDLFLMTFSNTGGVSTFVAVFLVLTGVLLFVVVSPSLFLAAMSHQVRKEIKGAAADTLPRAILFLGIGVIVTLMFFAKGWTLSGVLAGPLIGVLLHMLFLKKNLDQEKWSEIFATQKEGNQGWKGKAIAYSGTLWLCGVMTALPMVMAIPFMSMNNDSWYANLLGMGILVLVALGSLLPALIYCAMASQEKSLATLALGFLATTLALVYSIVLAAPESFDRVLERAATMIGLRVQEPYRYLLNVEQIDASVLDATKWNSKQEKQGVSLDATMPLSFADWIVLCPTSLKNAQDLKEHAMAQCFTAKRDAVLRLPVRQATE
jgi:hypothetical protein